MVQANVGQKRLKPFPIQRGIVLAMPPTGPTVDSAKKEKFISIFILRPESSVVSVMKQAKFTEEDIAILWGRLLDANHLMTPVVVSMAEHFSCLKHNTHNGEILVVVVTICTRPTLKKIISLEQNLNKCWVLITGERERVNLSSWADVCKVSKRA
jgi:hypothetical protein